MKFAVLIGEGANEVKIPCRIFSSMEKALERCKELLGPKFATYDEEEGLGRGRGFRYRWCFMDIDNDDDKFDISGSEEEGGEIAEKLFKSYYGGCGECYAYTLKEVEEDSVFVGWDLD